MLATLIAIYGVFMTPLGWGWAMFVWAYALMWFLFNDRVKLLAYRFLDPVIVKPEVEVAPGAKTKPPSDSKQLTAK